MKLKLILTTILLLMTGAAIQVAAQTAVTVGSQITDESQIVSGKAYVLQYGGNSNAHPYIKDNGSTYDVSNSQDSPTDKSLYFLISNGNGTWKIRNYYTGRFWGVPVYNNSNLSNLASADNESRAGAWSFNFSGSTAYPSAPDASGTIRGLNRSSQKLVGWNTGTDITSQVYIYEVSDAVLLTPPVSVTAGWYLISWVDVGDDTTTDYVASDVSGKYVRNYATDVTVSDASYPLYLAEEPTTLTDKAASLVYYSYNAFEGNAGVSGYLRSANGHYVTQTGAASTTASSQNVLIYNSRASYPYNSVISSALTGNRYSLVPKGKDATPYIGQTAQNKFPMVQFKRVKLSKLGLDAWTVVYQGEGQVTCSNANLQGLNKVYNGGTFFFTAGTTPAAADFTAETEGLATKVDATNKRLTIAPSATLTASDIAIIQGNETTGKGNTQQALLRMKLTPSAAEMTPTVLNITLSGIEQLENVVIYRTAIDELHAAAASPVKVSDDNTPAASLNIPLTTDLVDMGETVYLWVTADVKSTATEWETIDAAVTGVTYNNWAGSSHTLDLTAEGNPDGTMRIYKQQTALWTPDHANTIYYRIPTMLNTADGGIVALTDYRHDHPYDLGKNASNGVGPHVVDVVARRSTDGGLTWQDEVTVAAGDGINAATYGFGDPAIVRDADGTLHCLMAAGNASYASGMLHVGYSKSTDNGATWSAVSDIYSAIDKGGLDIASAFVTGGKGVTFANGRMAFAFLGKVNGTTNIYPFYSDDKGTTWHIQPTVAYGGGDESKLEVMNDGSLLLSVRKGSYNGTAVRSYNRTTGDASADGIANWGTAANWGSEMSANGCNADILYYNRSTEDASRPDVIFHTLTKAYSTYRKDLRLYMSFDQGATWQEAFSLQPGYAAYSSMQKLANGDLAIIFEDGSIGNKDKQDCYAINYVVLSSELINAKIDELYAAMTSPMVKNSVTGSSTGCDTWGAFSNKDTQWTRTWTSNASSGVAGLTITSNGYGFDKATNYDQRVMTIRPSADGATDKITITAPSGYVIDSYTITGRNHSNSQTYKFSADGVSEVTTSTGGATFSVNNVNASSTSFNFYGSSSTTNYLCITNFTIQLRLEPTITLNTVGSASYATLYLPYDVTTDGATKAYYVATATNGYAQLTEVTNNEIAAYTAVILINEEAATNTTLTPTDGLTQQVSESANLLKGTLCSRPLDLSDDNGNYAMGVLDGNIGFYKFDDGQGNANSTVITLGANKAYLQASGATAGVKGFTLSFGGENSIEDVAGAALDATSSERAIYSLSGQRLSRPVKGINIIGGKKVVVR